MTKKLRFVAAPNMRSYCGWRDKEEREISAVEADRLLCDFPTNFVEVVPPAPVKEEPVAPVEKAVEAAPNKAMPTGKNKGKWN